MSLSGVLRRLAAVFVSIAVLMSPIAGSIALAETDGLSVSISSEEVHPEDTVSITADYVVDGVLQTELPEGYYLWFWADIWGEGHTDGSTDITIGSNTGSTLSDTITFNSEGTYYIAAELQDSSYNRVDIAFVTVVVTEESSSEVLEDGLSVSISSEDVHSEDTVSITADYVVDGVLQTELPEGYYLWFWADKWGEGHTDGSTDITIGSNTGSTLSDTITFNSEGTYYIAAELQDSSYTRVDIAFVTVVVTEESSSEVLEDGLSVSISSEDVHPEDTVSITADYVVDGVLQTELPEGYNLWFWADIWGEGHTDGSTDITIGSNTGSTLSDTITFNSEGTYYIAAELQDSSYTRVDIAFVTVVVTEELIAEPVEGDINFNGVPTLPDDFYMGVDISSVVSELNAGVVYYDYNGNALTTVDQFVAFLASQGVNCVRVRVWNNPYDTAGNGFGGGNNDVATAKIIADACEASGITMLVDFHLSDFWCDPGKQQAPVAWADMSLEQKAAAIRSFIIDSLNTIDPNGNTVVMVQVGNETNGAICGESGNSNMCVLFDAGCDAVHEWNTNTRAVIHFTNPERSTIAGWAAVLRETGVSADVLATSYYPYWHGSLSNLTSQLNTARSYGFDVMVAETSYAYTLADSDGHDNTVRTGNNDTGTDLIQTFSVQGQARAVRDVVNAVNNAGGIGMFYWEPAWITVGSTIGLAGSEYDAQVTANRASWELYGCGWASSYAAAYDPTDAGQWYGGSAVDNEALFYADGTPTAAWGVYENIRTGEYSTVVLPEAAESFSQTIEKGGGFTLPGTSVVTYSDGSTASMEVTWDSSSLAAVNVNVAGTYIVTGVCEGLNISFTLTVLEKNLIAADIAGFETDTPDNSYSIEGNGIAVTSQDPRSGSHALHWWASEAVSGEVELSEAIALSESGTYVFTGYAQGDADKGSHITLSVIDASSGEVIATGESVTTIGYNNWVSPRVEFNVSSAVSVYLAVSIDYAADGWGTVDDLLLYLVSEDETESGEIVVPETVTPSENTPSGETPAAPAASESSSVTSPAAPGSVISDVRDNSSYIEMFYTTLLGRPSDVLGRTHWLSVLENNDDGVAEMVYGFFLSSEYIGLDKTDEEFVTDLYAVCLEREPEEAGFAYWLGKLASGKPRIFVIEGIITSEEFRLIHGKTE